MSGAGSLTERIAFDMRVEDNPDSPVDFGNVVSGWDEQFVCPAEFIHLRGGEAVMAARLTGRHPQIVRVRSSTLTREITTDWRARDVRRGTELAIRDVTPSTDRAWIDLLCESGVAP